MVPHTFAHAALEEIDRASLDTVRFLNVTCVCTSHRDNIVNPWTVRFALRHADADLTSILENSVPPLDISKVSIFATHLSKYHAEAR